MKTTSQMKSIRLLLAGDVTATGRTAGSLKAENRNQLWNNTRDLVQSHDYSICNLECPLLTAGVPIRKIGPNLNGDPMLAAFLKSWGFDAVGLANNHIMDFGPEGLESTFRTCELAGLKTFGAGPNLMEACAPHRVQIHGQRVSFIAAAEEEFCGAHETKAGVPPLRPISLFRRIKSERPNADWIIVIFHGGNEYYPLPRPGLQELCRFSITAGADAVVGHHPHVLGGYEVFEGKPIFYSLGNLLFDSTKPRPNGWQSGVFLSLVLSLGECPKFYFSPYTQGGPDQPGVILEDPERANVVKEHVERLRDIIETPPDLARHWHEFCLNAHTRLAIPFLAPYENRLVRKVFMLMCKARLLPTNYWTRSVLNRIRCESHRERFLYWAEESYTRANLRKNL